MTFTTLPAEELTLDKLLAEGRRHEAVFLTLGNEVRFVLMPADDGDQEVCALENNSQFMTYLREAIERAKTGKRYSLEEIKAEFGIKAGKRGQAKNSSNTSRRSQRKTA